MRTQYHPADPSTQAKTVLIILPGALQQPKDFIEAGFVHAVQSRCLQLDMHFVDLETEIVLDITSVATLQQIDADLIEPARRAGYETIWLAGISMGALMALAYTDCYAGKVDNLCLLSPYPGNRLLLREIEACGGLYRWRADEGVGNDTNLDAERRMWRRLQTFDRDGSAARTVHFGYGKSDRFLPGLQQLARALPEVMPDAIEGGHDWLTWEKLWCNFLDKTFVMKPG